jgi:kumamolisin
VANTDYRPVAKDWAPIPPPGARIIEASNPHEILQVTVLVRRRPSGEELPSAEEIGALAPANRVHLSHEEFEVRHGADAKDLAAVEAFAGTHDLAVLDRSPLRRTVTLSGAAANFSKAFQVELANYHHPEGHYRGHAESVRLPDELEPIVAGVFGLDNRTLAARYPQPLVIHNQPPEHQVQYLYGYLAALSRLSSNLRSRHADAERTLVLSLSKGLPDAVDRERYLKTAEDLQAALQTMDAARYATALRSFVQEYIRVIEITAKWYQQNVRNYLCELQHHWINETRRELQAYLNAHQLHLPAEMEQFYNFPANTDGKGQCIGILEFGGGFRLESIQAYFAFLGIPVPEIVTMSVSGATNDPGGNPIIDGEVSLDIEIAGSLAPAAKIVVYFAPPNARGWIDAIGTAIHDTIHKPSVIFTTFGAAENLWQRQPGSVDAVETLLREAATLGITVCAASGDLASSGGIYDGLAHVFYPASSPHVLCCGGTTLLTASDCIAQEYVWHNGIEGSSGGISDLFSLPSYQKNANIPPSINPGHAIGRGLPDVAGNGDPRTGYLVTSEGRLNVTGGTSAVAPLWAALIARINQSLDKRIGFLNPLLYNQLANTNGTFHDIIFGNNGDYRACPRWDACTGWGSPDGSTILETLKGA